MILIESKIQNKSEWRSIRTPSLPPQRARRGAPSSDQLFHPLCAFFLFFSIWSELIWEHMRGKKRAAKFIHVTCFTPIHRPSWFLINLGPTATTVIIYQVQCKLGTGKKAVFVQKGASFFFWKFKVQPITIKLNVINLKSLVVTVGNLKRYFFFEYWGQGEHV